MDHVAEALDRLLMQYKDAENIKALITGLSLQTQDEDDTLKDILEREIFLDAVGEQLDAWGVILNVPRGGMVDADYRYRLAIAIVQNHSEGTINDLIAILYSLLKPLDVKLAEVFPAGFLVYVNQPTETVPNIKDVIRNAKIAGVEFELIQAEEETFAFLDYVQQNNIPSGFGDIADPLVGGILSTVI